MNSIFNERGFLFSNWSLEISRVACDAKITTNIQCILLYVDDLKLIFFQILFIIRFVNVTRLDFKIIFFPF